MFVHRHKKGQSTLEYAVIIAVVVAALVAMQRYVKQGIEGRLKQAGDEIGEQFAVGDTTSTRVTISQTSSNETVRGGITRTHSESTQSSNVDEVVPSAAVR